MNLRNALITVSALNIISSSAFVLLLVNAYVFNAEVSNSSPLDFAVFLAGWGWLLLPPVTSVAALALNVKVRSRAAWLCNGVVLCLWMVSVVGSLLFF